ncbi:MAG: dihydroorotate dehydrogenase [Clostridia bacterium]
MNNMLETKMFGVTFNNPVFSASGTFGYGRDYIDYIKPHELGAVVTKGTSITEWIGNPPPRVYETASGMLNSIGLQNPGIEHFLDQDLPFLKKQNAKVILNVVGHTQKEYEEVVKQCQNQEGIHALEINISCPNVTEGGMAFGTDPEVAYKLLKSLKNISNIPLIAKLSPNVTDIIEIAKACEAAKVDSISLINTLSGIAIDIDTQKPILGNIYGGLSGPAIKPVALKMVYQVSQAVSLPIIGMGGIANGKDAIEFFLAGASAVQVGTSIFVDPQVHKKLIEEIELYLDKQSYSNITEIVGLSWKGN